MKTSKSRSVQVVKEPSRKTVTRQERKKPLKLGRTTR